MATADRPPTLELSYGSWARVDICRILDCYSIDHQAHQTKPQLFRLLRHLVRTRRLSREDRFRITKGRPPMDLVALRTPERDKTPYRRAYEAQVRAQVRAEEHLQGAEARVQAEERLQARAQAEKHSQRVQAQSRDEKRLRARVRAEKRLQRAEARVQAEERLQKVPNLAARGLNKMRQAIAKSTVSSHTLTTDRVRTAASTCVACLAPLTTLVVPHRRITRACNHNPLICSDCLTQSITSQSESKVWNHIDCPNCNARLDYEDIQAFATNATFQR